MLDVIQQFKIAVTAYSSRLEVSQDVGDRQLVRACFDDQWAFHSWLRHDEVVTLLARNNPAIQLKKPHDLLMGERRKPPGSHWRGLANGNQFGRDGLASHPMPILRDETRLF